jgi:hypothetical protein
MTMHLRLAVFACVSLTGGHASAETPKEAPPSAPDKEPGLGFELRFPITDPRTKDACVDRKLTAECRIDAAVGTCQPFECVWEGAPEADDPPGTKTFYPCVRCAIPAKAPETPPPAKTQGADGHGAPATHGDAPKADAPKAEADAAKPAETPPPAERCAPTAVASPPAVQPAEGAPAAAPEAKAEEGGCRAGGGGFGLLGGLAGLVFFRRRRA